MNIYKFFILAMLFAVSSVSLFAQKYELERLHSGINTQSYDEISPVLSLDGKKLYFTRVGYPLYEKTLVEKGEDLSQSMNQTGFIKYLKKIFTTLANQSVYDPIASSYNQDIWIAESVDDVFDVVEHPKYPLNNALPNSVCSITPSANEVILLNQFVEDGGMQKGFSVTREESEGVWTFPKPIKINNYHNSGPDVSMCMSQDGQIIIIAMERGDSKGLSDLYISFRTGLDEWSEPKNMGVNVNSINRETTPFLSADNSSLFFASDRRSTLGGTDLFMIKRLDEGWENWSQPRRFVEPINSPASDSQPFFNSNTGYLYFTSNRNGSSDIYRVKISPPNPIGVVVKGKVFNAKTEEPVSAKILSGNKASSLRNLYIADDGSYKITVPKGMEYVISAEKSGYTGNEETISFEKSYVYYKEYTVNLYLNPIEKGSKIELDPIYFEQSTANVLEKSYDSLDKLAIFLQENPYMYIQINGHTDNQGEIAALQKLSEERAAAIKDYLVYQKLIKPVRVSTKGYGPDQPLNDNSTEELRKQNRRVEAIITDISDPIFAEKKKKK